MRPSLALASSILVVLASPNLALAQPVMSTGHVLANVGEPYTMGRESMGKVVFVGGTWWGLFGSTTGLDFWRFDAPSQGWTKQSFPGAHLTNDVNSLADVKWDGSRLVVLFSQGSGSGALFVSAYSYSAPVFSLLSGFPSTVVSGGSGDQAVIKDFTVAEDTTGRLWVGYANTSRYAVRSSTGTGPAGWTSWNAPVFMGNASTGIDGDLGATGIVAFGTRIGLMWTECFNPPANQTKFSWREDSNPAFDASAWSPVELCQDDPTFTRLTDDHLSVKSWQGQVYAASKTNYLPSDAGFPRFTLMRRDTSGKWSHWTIKAIAQTADYSTRPVLVIDSTNGLLYTFWHNLGIQYNTTSLAAPGTFSSVQQMILPSGGGNWDCSSASGPPQDATSGLMVVADDNNDGWIYWNRLSLGTAPPPPPPPPTLASIAVTPNPASATTGGQVQFTAQGKDSSGNSMSVTPAWSATGGTITQAGLYTAGSATGTFTVTATSGSISGSASVQVSATQTQILTQIVVSPNPASTTPGGVVQFGAQGKDQNGGNMAISPAPTWATTAGTIDQTGKLTAGQATGTFDVSASSQGITGHASVTVSAPSSTTDVIVDNDTPGWSVVSGQWDLHYQPLRYGPSDRVISPGTSGVARWQPALGSGSYDVFAWWPSNTGPSVATYTVVTSSGNVAVSVDQTVSSTWGVWNKLGTFTLDGSTAAVTITAPAGQTTAADAVRFVSTGTTSPPPPPPPPPPGQTLTKITVTPDPASVPIGGTQTFTASATDQNGNPMTVAFSWTASGGTIDQQGNYAAGSAAGSFSVTATSGSVSGSATVNVTQPGTSAEVIVDDLDPGFTADSGTWDVHYTPFRYASTNHRIRAGETGVARFTPTLPSSGTYDVYAWWPVSDSTTTAVPFTVDANGVTQTLLIDETRNYGQWVLLGRFPLVQGSSVTVTASAGVNAAADATRFVFVSP